MCVILVICLWQGSGCLFLTDIELEARQCERSEESYPYYDDDSGLIYDWDADTGE